MPVKAVIDLKKIVYNAKRIKARLPEKVKFCAVVKADAYGHGAERVANALYNIVDCFAVATVAEGVKLRYAGINKDILVLTRTLNSDLPAAVDNSLTLTVGEIGDLKRYSREGKRQSARVKVHIKYDTGMRRQGVNGEDLEYAFAFCEGNEYLQLDGVYSHFARPENDVSRERVLKKFGLAETLAKKYNDKGRNIVCHISASGGFLKGEYADMVRIGILLYGYAPFKTDVIRVKPAMKVYAPVLLRRKLKRGDCALYGEKRAAKDTEIALIGYGYADGLFRKEKKGQFNARCMDVTAVTGVKRGAKRVAVMGDADKIAREYETISYEILVKCARRAEKEYKT